MSSGDEAAISGGAGSDDSRGGQPVARVVKVAGFLARARMNACGRDDHRGKRAQRVDIRPAMGGNSSTHG